MERHDKRNSEFWGMFDNERRNDKVVFEGNGREAELIVAGLQVLRTQIALRDLTVAYSDLDRSYPRGRRQQGGGVPLAAEVAELLDQIAIPQFEAEPAQRQT